MISQDLKLNKLIDRDFIELIKSVVDHIINNDDQKKAFEIARLMEKAKAKYRNELDNELDNFYNKLIVKAKFIALPLLDNDELVSLIKNYFTWQFHIPNYDFLNKFNNKMINIEIFEERDKTKEEIRRVLEESSLIITSKAPLKRTDDWIRDYNGQLGIRNVDNLKRTQYFIDLKKAKGINDYDLKNLRVLFDFYEKLKLSSLSPLGFNEDIPIDIENKSYIFKQGRLESVGQEVAKARTVSGPPKTEEEKMIEELKSQERKYKVGGLEREVIEENIEKEERIEELKIEANRYEEGSLEKKAIEEEIKKLELRS